jgi:hypothetical protein
VILAFELTVDCDRLRMAAPPTDWHLDVGNVLLLDGDMIRAVGFSAAEALAAAEARAAGVDAAARPGDEGAFIGSVDQAHRLVEVTPFPSGPMNLPVTYAALQHFMGRAAKEASKQLPGRLRWPIRIAARLTYPDWYMVPEADRRALLALVPGMRVAELWVNGRLLASMRHSWGRVWLDPNP